MKNSEIKFSLVLKIEPAINMNNLGFIILHYKWNNFISTYLIVLFEVFKKQIFVKTWHTVVQLIDHYPSQMGCQRAIIQHLIVISLFLLRDKSMKIWIALLLEIQETLLSE